MDEDLRTKSCLLYHLRIGLIRPNMPLRHRCSGVPPSGSIAYGNATAPLHSGVQPKKIPPWIFLGIEELHGSSSGC